MKDVYVALGGNIGDSASVFRQALHQMALIEGIFDLKCSSFYQTTPVSPVKQDDFLNAVCVFHTELLPQKILDELQKIEFRLGKVPKSKDAPRVLDLDILFFGTEPYKDSDLEIPHPRWAARKFVLIPLLELTEEIKQGNSLFNIRKMIELLPNNNKEVVKKVII